MRNFLLLLAIIPTMLFAQKQEVKDQFLLYTESEYYTIDGDNIVVSKVIDNLPGTKDEIYVKVKSFFTRTYKVANSVLQMDDKGSGVIIGKGYFKNAYVFTKNLIVRCTFSTYHVLRVDIKDGRIRVICNASIWDYVWDQGGQNYKLEEKPILAYAPFTDKRFIDKGNQMEGTIALVDLMHSTIDALEKSIKSGGLAVEKDEW